MLIENNSGWRLFTLTDETGVWYQWAAQRAKGGHYFRDHDGVQRFAPGNAAECVEKVALVAGNYGFTFRPDVLLMLLGKPGCPGDMLAVRVDEHAALVRVHDAATATTARKLALETALRAICDAEPDTDGTTAMQMRLIAKNALRPVMECKPESSLLSALQHIATQAAKTAKAFPNAPGNGDWKAVEAVALDAMAKAKGSPDIASNEPA